jgi:hypothetical protein
LPKLKAPRAPACERRRKKMSSAAMMTRGSRKERSCPSTDVPVPSESNATFFSSSEFWSWI